jgi:3',5'-cyclic AMP phosphodiesterase CpdA
MSVGGAPARPRRATFDELGFLPRPPTRWLAPRRLIRTTGQTMLAHVVGGYTDRRETLAALDDRADPVEDLDFSADQELWIDVVSDTGDGFAATYAVAWTLAQDRLAVDGLDEPLPAGRLLVFGGDEVYPVASDDEYRDRLVGPYQAALPWREEDRVREMVAIPGNHDWYDGLGAWSRRFCQQRWLGAWRTHQRRSYAAVRLPHHWWIWAVDIALSGQVDEPQVRYFTAMAERAAAAAVADGTTARLVIVTSKPTWVDAVPGGALERRLDPALDHLETNIARRNGLHLAAVLSGDDHYYARYASVGGGPQRVTCGGGGAFLHPTDHLPTTLSVASRAWPEHEGDDELRLQALEPSRARSRALRWRALGFGFHNGGFPLVTALAYLAWLLTGWGRVVAVLGFFLAAAAMSRRPTLPGRALWGAPHNAAHVGVMTLAVWVADQVVSSADGTAWGRGAALLLAGAVIGPVVIGLYFVAAGTTAGVNDNEAFSAIGYEGHKGFLRLHLDGTGQLLLYALGIRDVPRQSAWAVAPDAPPEAAWFAPATGQGPPVHLVDGPVRLD